jgi:hypothetical protein
MEYLNTESDEVEIVGSFISTDNNIEHLILEAIQNAYVHLSLEGFCEELDEAELKDFCNEVEVTKISETSYEFMIEDYLFTIELSLNH